MPSSPNSKRSRRTSPSWLQHLETRSLPSTSVGVDFFHFLSVFVGVDFLVKQYSHDTLSSSCLFLTNSFPGHPQFEEPQQPVAYSQVSAAAMALPGAPSWASESHKPAPPASGQSPGPLPKDVANLATAFTVQQNPPTGSATPSLSSCSTVRTKDERLMRRSNWLVRELLVVSALSVFSEAWGGLKVPNCGQPV